jgi:hypothetical protein
MFKRTISKILVLGLVAIVIVLGYLGIDIGYSLTHPTYRHVRTTEVKWPENPTFNNCWNDPSKRFRGGMDWVAAPGAKPLMSDADCTYLPVNGDPDMVLVVLIPKNLLGAPGMQLQITSLVEVRTKYSRTGAIMPEAYGDPDVRCDLNGPQAAWVVQNGIPQSLIDAMQAAAKQAGWRPIDPNGESTAPPIIQISPTSHFAVSAAGTNATTQGDQSGKGKQGRDP